MNKIIQIENNINGINEKLDDNFKYIIEKLNIIHECKLLKRF